MIDPYDIPSIADHIEYIKVVSTEDDLYRQLAEEASELAQAALKMCRVNSTTNPTPKGEKEAIDNLIEEYTDVLNVAMRLLRLQPDWLIGDYKLYRWAKRLEAAQEKKAEHVCNEDFCEVR